MLDAIPSRTYAQVKAHHTKMMRRFGSVEGVMERLAHPLNSPLLAVAERLGACSERAKELEHSLLGEE